MGYQEMLHGRPCISTSGTSSLSPLREWASRDGYCSCSCVQRRRSRFYSNLRSDAARGDTVLTVHFYAIRLFSRSGGTLPPLVVTPSSTCTAGWWSFRLQPCQALPASTERSSIDGCGESGLLLQAKGWWARLVCRSAEFGFGSAAFALRQLEPATAPARTSAHSARGIQC